MWLTPRCAAWAAALSPDGPEPKIAILNFSANRRPLRTRSRLGLTRRSHLNSCCHPLGTLFLAFRAKTARLNFLSMGENVSHDSGNRAARANSRAAAGPGAGDSAAVGSLAG